MGNLRSSGLEHFNNFYHQIPRSSGNPLEGNRGAAIEEEEEDEEMEVDSSASTPSPDGNGTRLVRFKGVQKR